MLVAFDYPLSSMVLKRLIREGIPRLLVVIAGLSWAGLTWSDHASRANPASKRDKEVMVKYFDRDLRLLEAGERGSVWERWLVGAADSEDWLRKTKDRVAQMDKARLGDDAEGLQKGLKLRLGEEVERDPSRDDPHYRADLKEWLLEGNGRAWDYDLYLHQGEDADVRESYESGNNRLLRRSRWMSTAYISITLLGVACLIRAFIKRGEAVASASRLPSSWAVSWVLGGFFLTNFLLIPWLWVVGLGYGFYYSLGGQADIYVIYDLLWRMFPAAILTFLFLKTPVNLWRVFELGKRVNWSLVFAGIAIFALKDWILFYLPPVVEVDPTDFMESASLTRRGLVLLLFSSALVAPIFEEIVFRGFLFQGLRGKTGTVGAALISSILFAVTHTQYDLLGWISVGTMGIVACWLTVRTGSLKSSIALHALANLIIFLDVYYRYQMPL